MNILQKALLGTIALAFIAPATFAAEQTSGKKTKEITELVGYDVKETEMIVPGERKSAAFKKADMNKDGIVTSKEFMAKSNREDAYSVFLSMDTNNDKQVTLEEYGSYNATKGNTHVASELHGKVKVKGTNLKSRVIQEKQYYVPVDREIVAVEPIEPAAGE